MYFQDIVLRIAAWLGGITLALVWIYMLAHAFLPRLGAALSCFILTPGGIILVVLAWRALGRQSKRS